MWVRLPPGLQKIEQDKVTNMSELEITGQTLYNEYLAFLERRKWNRKDKISKKLENFKKSSRCRVLKHIFLGEAKRGNRECVLVMKDEAELNSLSVKDMKEVFLHWANEVHLEVDFPDYEPLQGEEVVIFTWYRN